MTAPHSPARCRAVAAVAVQELRRHELFQYDVIYKTPTTPGLRTSVRRTLLGVSGITYKYLGIRPPHHHWHLPQGAAQSATP